MVYQLPSFDHIEQPVQRGRNIRDGYARGWGIQFGSLRESVRADPLYQYALGMTDGRSIQSEDNRVNLFLIMKFGLTSIASGSIIEFGSYRGGSAIFMAAVCAELYPETTVYALDTFGGMPQTDKAVDAHSKGDFADVNFEELSNYVDKIGLNNLKLVRGMFSDTCPSLLSDIKPIILSHIDCDIRSAVIYSYDVSKKHMAPGGYIIFDDATVSSCIGATEAVEELVIRRDGLHSEQIFPHFVFRIDL